MILSCQQISLAFGTEVILDKISFHIEEHEKTAIVGINGAGKSTLLKIIMGERYLLGNWPQMTALLPGQRVLPLVTWPSIRISIQRQQFMRK